MRMSWLAWRNQLSSKDNKTSVGWRKAPTKPMGISIVLASNSMISLLKTTCSKKKSNAYNPSKLKIKPGSKSFRKSSKPKTVKLPRITTNSTFTGKTSTLPMRISFENLEKYRASNKRAIVSGRNLPSPRKNTMKSGAARTRQSVLSIGKQLNSTSRANPTNWR